MENRIKMVRELKNISLPKLAELTGIRYNLLWKYENNQVHTIPNESLKLIAEVLGADPTYLSGYAQISNDNEKIYNDADIIEKYQLDEQEMRDFTRLKKMSVLLFEEDDVDPNAMADLDLVLKNMFITAIKRKRARNKNK